MTATMLVGSVVSVSGTTAVVDLGDDESRRTLQKLRSVSSINPGDACLVLSEGGARYIVGVLGAAPAPPPEPPAPDPAPTPGRKKGKGKGSGGAGGGSTGSAPKPPKPPKTGTKTFQPTWAGSYRGGWRSDTSSLFQGDWTGRGTNTGAAYYGNGPSSLQQITGAYVLLYRGSGGSYAAQAPTMVLLAGKKRPGGAPRVLATARGPKLSINPKKGGKKVYTKFRLPASWLSRLASGEAGGIGIRVSGRNPYIQLSPAGAGMSLTCHWKET